MPTGTALQTVIGGDRPVPTFKPYGPRTERRSTSPFPPRDTTASASRKSRTKYERATEATDPHRQPLPARLEETPVTSTKTTPPPAAPGPAPATTSTPTWATEVTRLLTATENHPDAVVRACRRTVAQTLVALGEALNAVDGPAKIHVHANGAVAASTRIARLGTTTKAVRAWALEQGLKVHPTRGVIPDAVIDAYEAAHGTPS